MGSPYQEMPTGYNTPKTFVKLVDTTLGVTVLVSRLLETMSNFLKNIFVDWFRKQCGIHYDKENNHQIALI